VPLRTVSDFAVRAVLLSLFPLFPAIAVAQQDFPGSEIPDKFNLDMQTAARLRPKLISASMPATGPYATGHAVFKTLLKQINPPGNVRVSWELRIVHDGLLNAYSSPDGAIFVESGLAKLAGSNAGLWAAILSHEMAHIVHRDWARRYLYEKSLQSGSGSALVLGDPGADAEGWIDSRKASEDLARFCRRMELDADVESLRLMTRAGFHPDFVPSLHHLLHAYRDSVTESATAMHPRWEERDRELQRAYIAESIEFDRLWPDRYASPGGNPPVVVFEEQATVRKVNSTEWEILVPMRCQNLVGAVEVVLLERPARHEVTAGLQQLPESSREVRQLTGCTSPETTITFTFTDGSDQRKAGESSADVYILDAEGAVLSRADVPRLRR